jgi:hypothetical protein
MAENGYCTLCRLCRVLGRGLVSAKSRGTMTRRSSLHDSYGVEATFLEWRNNERGTYVKVSRGNASPLPSAVPDYQKLQRWHSYLIPWPFKTG